jgi:hypothetical protein
MVIGHWSFAFGVIGFASFSGHLLRDIRWSLAAQH